MPVKQADWILFPHERPYSEKEHKAITASPAWASVGTPVSVVRPSTGESAILVRGSLGKEEKARLEHLKAWFWQARARCRAYTYSDVELLTETLAARLRECMGEGITDVDWTAIPRGGLIVLGLLSYALGLKQQRINNGLYGERPLVVVDDCALTGNRFSRFMEGVGDREIIFAHLSSPKGLRKAIVSAEPTVSHCVAANTLRDMAPEIQGDGYLSWRERAHGRFATKRYWVGQPEIPIFRWSEPDHNFWNPVTQRVESGWRLASPDACLKNKYRPASSAETYYISEPSGAFDLGEGVLYYPGDEGVFIVDSNSGVHHRLEGAGAVIWEMLLSEPSVDTVVTRLVSVYEVSRQRAARDTIALVEKLENKGLIVPRPKTNF